VIGIKTELTHYNFTRSCLPNQERVFVWIIQH
jgi:hypothetical protein